MANQTHEPVVQSKGPGSSPAGKARSWTVKHWAGLAACALAVPLSFAVHLLVPSIPVMTTAVVLGVLSANIPGLSGLVSGPWKAGLGFAGKKLMRAGIVLLGLKLSIVDVLELGWATFAVVVAIVLLAFGGTYLLGKAFRLPGDQPLLIATGFSICGASAIGAMSAVRRSKEKDTVIPVALVTLCGTLAIAVLPLLMVPLGLGPEAFGTWVGASVHDVGQVVATAQTAGGSALAIAIIVKLTRVLTLAPMVAAAGIISRRTNHGAGSESEGLKLPPIIPGFIIGFVALVAVRSIFDVPAELLDAATIVQDIVLAAALFGLGSAVRISQLFASKGASILMALCSWALIAGLGYAGVLLLQL
ncbi:YeiH family protein [Paeniglutamicibacter gangotriensis]|uniref:Membrane spanning protein n=1 Tax=Paeniglutamicibacter gangotriensis Lz1y TaxID=1276920 RepID=M7NFN3_9MICC|nr:putative sulfate exporter family transporter [Paeniglutamicibacter gangotriensis]EMQ97288.1 membrane spanning protein [Paeniglutamicibacter gangotriensis Lz1y]